MNRLTQPFVILSKDVYFVSAYMVKYYNFVWLLVLVMFNFWKVGSGLVSYTDLGTCHGEDRPEDSSSYLPLSRHSPRDEGKFDI